MILNYEKTINLDGNPIVLEIGDVILHEEYGDVVPRVYRLTISEFTRLNSVCMKCNANHMRNNYIVPVNSKFIVTVFRDGQVLYDRNTFSVKLDNEDFILHTHDLLELKYIRNEKKLFMIHEFDRNQHYSVRTASISRSWTTIENIEENVTKIVREQKVIWERGDV